MLKGEICVIAEGLKNSEIKSIENRILQSFQTFPKQNLIEIWGVKNVVDVKREQNPVGENIPLSKCQNL